ncbi:MAG: bifunctional diaminohydroxyphosphoribosylaminopyrimidine deaminase/5-amino-6-(5-phosphoribosylamino)uracil reductase RibD [Akkermansia sp.]
MSSPSESSVNADAFWMQRALKLAYQSYGTSSPNPPVGAVIVRDGRLLGEGRHICAGGPHAERRALTDTHARGNSEYLRGATLYVTLEPCSSVGRTPACTDAILASGITRVVYGAIDPDKRHQGRADALLRAAGISVCPGVERAACELLLRSWAFSVQQGRPWVTAKVATTLDGHLTRRSERFISTAETLRYAHELRLRSDAILIGGGTLRSDNPALTIRTPISPIPAEKKQPWRIVVTQRPEAVQGRGYRMFCDAAAERSLVVGPVYDWKAFLQRLHEERGVVNLMLECGGKLLRRLLEEGLVNEWMQEIAPLLSGGKDAVLPGDSFLPQEFRLQVEQCRNIDGHVLLRGILT